MLEQYSQLVSKVYDTTLEPDSWSDVLFDVAMYLGAYGAAIFEVLEGEEQTRLISPHYSSNYEEWAMQDYLKTFSQFELEDQISFAERSVSEDKIQLVNDIDLAEQDEAFFEQPHMQFLRKRGIYHRTGAVLNKDSWNIDRFSLQYASREKAASDEEKAKAELLLPHLSKALRIGRPLSRANGTHKNNIQKQIDQLDFGVALITQQADLIICNQEFERICDITPAFQRLPNGKLEIHLKNNGQRFRELMEDEETHGQHAAQPRKDCLVVTSEDNASDGQILVEISPIHNQYDIGHLPKGTRLIIAFDSSRAHEVDTSVVGRFYPLSKSEREILNLMAKGFSNSEISDIRDRSIETVHTQVKTLLRKTYSRNRTELVQLSVALKTPFTMRVL